MERMHELLKNNSEITFTAMKHIYIYTYIYIYIYIYVHYK